MTASVLVPRSLVASEREALPGTWWKTDGSDSAPGAVSLKCPQCGLTATLRRPATWPRPDGGLGHAIAADGSVSPSVVCPYKPCTWHVWARLDGWQP